MSYDYLFKIIFVGDTCVGKTALTHRISRNWFQEHYNSTIGVDFATVMVDINDKKIKSHIWDTAGQKCFATIIASYFRGIAGAAVVFDVGNKSSFCKCEFWINQINNNSTTGHNPVMILIGNKIDSSNREVSRKEAEDFANENGMTYYETSARKDIGVRECYHGLLREICETTDLDVAEERYGIRKGMIQSKVTEERDCCTGCTIL